MAGTEMRLVGNNNGISDWRSELSVRAVVTCYLSLRDTLVRFCEKYVGSWSQKDLASNFNNWWYTYCTKVLQWTVNLPLAETQCPILTTWRGRSLIWLTVVGDSVLDPLTPRWKHQGRAQLLSSWQPGSWARKQHQTGAGEGHLWCPRPPAMTHEAHLEMVRLTNPLGLSWAN